MHKSKERVLHFLTVAYIIILYFFTLSAGNASEGGYFSEKESKQHETIKQDPLDGVGIADGHSHVCLRAS